MLFSKVHLGKATCIFVPNQLSHNFNLDVDNELRPILLTTCEKCEKKLKLPLEFSLSMLKTTLFLNMVMQLSQLKCLFIQLSRKRLLNGDISILILTTFVGWTSVGLDLHKNKTVTVYPIAYATTKPYVSAIM